MLHPAIGAVHLGVPSHVRTGFDDEGRVAFLTQLVPNRNSAQSCTYYYIVKCLVRRQGVSLLTVVARAMLGSTIANRSFLKLFIVLMLDEEIQSVGLEKV